MADVATGTPAPAAPASTPAPTSAPTAAPGGGGGSSTQPGAPAAPPETAPPATGDNTFDLPRPGPIAYNKYREERAQWRKQLAALQARTKDYDQLTAKQAAYEKQVQELTERQENFAALQRVIQNNPRLQRMLEEELGEVGTAPQTKAQMELPPELLDGLRGIKAMADQINQAQRVQLQQDQQREIQDVRTQVQDTLKPLLKSKGFDDAFLPQVEAYVFRRINELGEDADFEQIPFLFAEWALPWLERDQARTTTLVNGKREDGALPQNPASSLPVGAVQPKHALDEGTTKRALEFVTSKMGWSG